ncbi:MAG: glycosyltransferase [Algoriphagus sp.]
MEEKSLDLEKYSNLKILLIRLVKNMGHQRAIAVGLCYAYETIQSEWVGIMDSDGEDQPHELFRLAAEAKTHNSSAFAKRSKRSEGLLFRMFYVLYKSIFQLLCGQRVNFGNFSVIKGTILKSLVHESNLWNNYAIAFLKLKKPFIRISTHRGKRYQGVSKMNFTQLIIHGLSGIAIFADVVTTRIILFSLGTIVSTLLGMMIVIGIRLTTDMAIPGWATYSVLALAILLFQAVLISFFTLFIFLSNRSSLGITPVKEYKTFIE